MGAENLAENMRRRQVVLIVVILLIIAAFLLGVYFGQSRVKNRLSALTRSVGSTTSRFAN